MTMADRIAILDGGELQQIGAPEVVFNEPTNTFVAGFIGSPNINFFEGSVEPTADGYRVSTAGAELVVPESLAPADVEGQSITLGVRPQDLSPTGERASSDMTVTGTIELIEPLGTEAIVRVETPDGPVTALVDAYEGLERDQELSLGIDAEEVYLFDADGELLKPRHYDVRTGDEVTA